MRTLVLEPHMGASGDMLLGALLDAGADRSVLAPVEDGLGVEYAVNTVSKSGITATAVDVVLETTADREHHHADDEPSERHHGDEDSCERHHGAHDHAHGDHEHSHAEGHGRERTLAEVTAIVEDLAIPSPVREDALAVFDRLAAAEGAVHGEDPASATFHAVGADDAIADVVGTALLLADLDVDRVLTTPVSAGGGTVTIDHGEYPVPVPAVVELAADAGWSLRGGPVEAELLTPTGAALLAEFADGVETVPPIGIETSGYGAGGYDFPDRPNVLRATVGDVSADEHGGSSGRTLTADPRLRGADVVVLETTVDDVPPEVLGSLHETLAEAGARDVSIVPLTMKKSRPGHLVTAITKPADADDVAARLARETGTLGIRESLARHRWVAERETHEQTLELAGGEFTVAVKVASDADGTVYDVSAEYDDASAVAAETGLPVRDVMRRAEDAYRDG